MKRIYSPMFLIGGLVIFLLSTAGLGGCANGRVLTGSDRDTVLAYSEPVANNLLQGMNAGDYQAFSRDFNATMLKALPAASFTSSIETTVIGKLGKYQSRQVSNVTAIGADIVILYNAVFEKDSSVKITLTLESAAPHKVAGLYFNSPTLSQP